MHEYRNKYNPLYTNNGSIQGSTTVEVYKDLLVARVQVVHLFALRLAFIFIIRLAASLVHDKALLLLVY